MSSIVSRTSQDVNHIWDKEDKALDEKFKESLRSVLQYILVLDSEDIFKHLESDTDLIEIFKGLVDAIKDINTISNSSIASVVFLLPDNDGMDTVIVALKTLVKNHMRGEETNDNINKKLIKIVSNIELANTQKDSLFKNQQKDISKLTNGYNEFNSKLNDSAEKLEKKFIKKEDELEKEFIQKVDSMYNSFISVLGIFIAISFSLFGAATLLDNIFTIATENGFDTSSKVVGTNIMLGGIVSILIYLLIIGLIQGICTVTGKDFVFSLRKLFVILSVAFGVVLLGFIYGHTSINKSHIILLMLSILIYTIIMGTIYRWGTPFKNFLIKHNKNQIKKNRSIDNDEIKSNKEDEIEKSLNQEALDEYKNF